MSYILSAAPLIAALFGIYLTSFYGYLLFHSLAEGFSIAIAFGIFMIAWNARRLLQSHYLLFIGIAYLFIGGIDFLHVLAYKGMGIFESSGANLATQLWIAGRYVEALSLLLATIFLQRKFHPPLAFLVFGISTGLLLTSIFYWKIFPYCFIEGVGLTPFKIYSEYVICLILLAAIGFLLRKSKAFDRKVLSLLIASMAAAIVQELAFTTYLSVYGPSNMIGHLLKTVSFYLVYKAIIETSLVAPCNLLFRDLKQSEAKFRSAFANAAIGFAMTTPDGRFMDANPAYCALTGYRIEELHELDFPGLIHSDDFSENMTLIERMLAGEIADFVVENRYFQKGGGAVWVRKSVSLVRNPEGAPQWIIALVEDITARKQAEQTLRESEHRAAEARDLLNAIIEGSPDLVAAQDMGFRYTALNKTYVEEFEGVFGGEIRIGTSMIEALAHLPEERANAVELWHRAQKGETFTLEHEFGDPGRARKCFNLSFSPIRAADGQITGAAQIGRDITKRKQMEEELRKSRDELDLRVQERTAELQVSNKALMEHAAKLERLNKELQDFAFVAAHDLQEPLRKIQTFSDMAIKRCEPALDIAGKEYLGKVIRSAARMRELLHDLLEFSRVAEKPGPFKKVDLERIVGEVAYLFKEDLKQSNGLIEIEEMPVIEADEAQMLRLFQNLLGNALKYRNTESPRIKIHAKRVGERYEIIVEDNGIGFEQQYAERIFKPFQRLHRRDEYGGAGMGLAMCRKIVEWHGGSIRAESEPGKGSRFIIELPVNHKQRGRSE